MSYIVKNKNCILEKVNPEEIWMIFPTMNSQTHYNANSGKYDLKNSQNNPSTKYSGKEINFSLNNIDAFITLKSNKKQWDFEAKIDKNSQGNYSSNLLL